MLGVTTNDLSSDEHQEVKYPGQMRTYRLYPGGKLYSVGDCSGTLQDMTLSPDPGANPAGICYSNGAITFQDNVNFTGTLVSVDRFYLRGSNLDIRPVSLPPLYGSAEPVQLVVLATRDDVRIYEGCQGTISGMVTIDDDFELHTFSTGIDLTISGRVLFKRIKCYSRLTWPAQSSQWNQLLADFDAVVTAFEEAVAQGSSSPATPENTYFPAYFESQGYARTPRVTIKPPAQAVRYHWPQDGASIYVAHPDDPGLMWDLLDWRDGV